MKDKHILIVDDEVNILTVLKNSLKKLGAHYKVTTATDGFEGLQLLRKQQFDMIVTDYQMAGLNGLELLEAIRTIQPNARVILITAYGNEALEKASERLQAYRFVEKPLEINSFRKLVENAFDDVAISQPGFLALSDNRYREIISLLEQLKQDVGGRCLFLVDTSGNVVAQVGDKNDFKIEEIGLLLGGGMATLLEAGRILDGQTDTLNLTYREGEHEYLYAINVGLQILLILVIDHSPHSSRLGSVWYYAQRAVVNLRQRLGEMGQNASLKQLLNDDMKQALDNEIDKLFSEF